MVQAEVGGGLVLRHEGADGMWTAVIAWLKEPYLEAMRVWPAIVILLRETRPLWASLTGFGIATLVMERSWGILVVGLSLLIAGIIAEKLYPRNAGKGVGSDG